MILVHTARCDLPGCFAIKFIDEEYVRYVVILRFQVT